MTTRLSRLNELSAELNQVIEFQSTSDDRKKAAMIAAGAGAGAYGLKKTYDLGKLTLDGLSPANAKNGIGASLLAGAVAAPQVAADRVSAKMKQLKKWSRRTLKKMAMSGRHENLIELSAHLDTIELGRYDEDGDSRMLKDAAVIGTGAAGIGGAGLYLRNRGDSVNAARHAELLKAGAGKLKEGMEGPTIPAKFEDFRGSSWNAVKTGAKDATGGIRSKLAGLLSKLRISRGVPTIKASAKHERLLELSAELDGVVEFARGDQKGLPTMFSSRHENLITLSSELDDVVELSLKPGRGARLISRLDELAHASGRKIDSKTLSFLQDHVRSNKMTGLMGRMKGYDAPRTLPDAGEALTDQLRSIAKTAPRLRALSAELDKVINLDIEDGAIGAGLVGAGGLGAYKLHQRGAGIKVSKKEQRDWLKSNGPSVINKPHGVPSKMMANYAENPGVMRNIGAGAKDLWKSGKSYLRAALK